MDAIRRQAPKDHYEKRKNGGSPRLLVLHFTASATLRKADDYFTGRKKHPSGGKVSAHYMWDTDGTVYQYVDEDKRAYHAGVSFWDGVQDVNSYSIGGEFVNAGYNDNFPPFPDDQIDAAITDLRDIIARNNISPFDVIGHSDVAPGRKNDPGHNFDWKKLAENGIGVWPEPEDEDFDTGRDYLKNKKTLRAAFNAYGYDPKAELKDVVTAFQQHFHPEIFTKPSQAGRMTEETAARLAWLNRKKKARQAGLTP